MAGRSRSGKSRNSRSRNSRRSEGIKWFGVDRRFIIFGGVVLLLIILLVPMFSAVKVIEVTETVMATVQKEVPETVTEDVLTKVYVGYLQEQGQGQAYGGNVPVIVVIGGSGVVANDGSSMYTTSAGTGSLGASADTGSAGASSDYGPSYGPSYNTYGSSGRRYQIDVSDEIVDFQQANGPDRSLTITTTSASGKSTVYRYINKFDLTKTGETKIPTTVTRTKIVSVQEPQTITREEIIPIRVPLIQLLSVNLKER
ncbi:MAG TPA: hypothetical protein VF366_05220 [Dehalococcoidia bacterium]